MLFKEESSDPSQFLIGFIVPMIICVAVFWFLMIRPQRKQMKEREDMLNNIKRNDHVLTTGGIFGVVDRVKDNEVVLRIDEKGDVKIRVARSAIVGVEKRAAVEEGKEQEEKKSK